MKKVAEFLIVLCGFVIWPTVSIKNCGAVWNPHRSTHSTRYVLTCELHMWRLNHCPCRCAEPAHLFYYSHGQTAEGYPCAWHCRGNERTLKHFWWSLVMLTSGCRGVLFNPWHFCWPLLTAVQPRLRSWGDLCGCNPVGSHATQQKGCFGQS